MSQPELWMHNIAWNALCTHQSHIAFGGESAKRYLPGYSPILGFMNQNEPDFDALRSICDPSEKLYCEGWQGPVPEGWDLLVDAPMLQMIYRGDIPSAQDEADVVELGPAHSAQMLSLARLTNPGPFGKRTVEMGDYLGVFDGDTLVAMAGERFYAGPLREISGVCTHPGYQGRGLARRLMVNLIRREMNRGETPCLHVIKSNAIALGLYERMGFETYRETTVRVVQRHDEPA